MPHFHHLIVGLGDIAHAHARDLTHLGERVSFCSRDGAKAERYRQRHGGVAAFDNLSTALANPGIDSCVICVPHDLHEEVATAAIRAGKHVLLEKPIAHTLASAERIVALAKNSNKTVMIAEQMEYLPVLANVKRFVANKQPVSYVLRDHSPFQPTGWRTDRESSGGGVLLDLGIHYVSFAVKAFGPIVSHRKKVLQTLPGTEVPSYEQLHMRHAAGAEGDVDVAWGQEERLALMNVHAGSKTLVYTMDRRMVSVGGVPQLVTLRSANGRLQMMTEYLSRCASVNPVRDIAEALPALAAVLSA